MNKFVKGAKHLAFALSFVTVAACGKGKEIEDLKKQVEACKNDAIEAKNSVSNLKLEVDGCVKTEGMTIVRGDIEDLKKKSNEVMDLIKGGNLKNLSAVFGDKIGKIVDCSKYKISVKAVSGKGKKVVVKIENDGKNVCTDVFKGIALDEVKDFDSYLVYLGNIVSGGGNVVLGLENVFAGNINNVKFGGAIGLRDIFVRICKLLNVLGVKADQCGLDKVFAGGEVWGIVGTSFNLSCKVLVDGLNAFAGREVCKVKDSDDNSGNGGKTVVLLEDVFGGSKNATIVVATS